MENQILKYYQKSSKTISLRINIIQMLIVSFMERTKIHCGYSWMIQSVCNSSIKKYKLATLQEWNKVMHERTIKNTQFK